MDDCLTAINGVPVDKSSGLHEVMACIRAAKSPLSLRFARYPPAPLLHSSSSSLSSFFSGSSASATGSTAAAVAAGGVATAVPSPPAPDSKGNVSSGSRASSGNGDFVRSGQSAGSSSRGSGFGNLPTTAAAAAAAARTRAGTGGDAEDPELDGVLNSALVLGLGERVADIQKRNARLLQEVDRIGRAAADKRKVCFLSKKPCPGHSCNFLCGVFFPFMYGLSCCVCHLRAALLYPLFIIVQSVFCVPSSQFKSVTNA